MYARCVCVSVLFVVNVYASFEMLWTKSSEKWQMVVLSNVHACTVTICVIKSVIGFLLLFSPFFPLSFYIFVFDFSLNFAQTRNAAVAYFLPVVCCLMCAVFRFDSYLTLN